MSLEKYLRRDLDAAERSAPTQVEIGPGAIASLLSLHASTLRGIARQLDGDFDPHGFEGAKTQGELRRIARELEELAGDARKLKP